ncbi:MAG: cupin domain-containing protein [Gammaproteobacteria bacterium]
MDPRLTLTNALKRLDRVETPFERVFSYGSMEVEIYAPKGEDLQQPHTRDELYIVASGNGFFVHETERHSVEAGEVLFVPAGDVHRFEDFSDDFATWVVFYGPEGGEKEP